MVGLRRPTMPAYRIKAIVPESRRLTVKVPPETPIGEVDVVVFVPPGVEESTPPTRSMREFLQELESRPRPTLSPEEIEARIQELRGS
jgi:hypothetical protein